MISGNILFLNYPYHNYKHDSTYHNEEQIIQEIAIDGAVMQVWFGSNRASLFT